VVAASGPTNARVFIIGECPESESDLMGEPFVDRAGTLLRSILKRGGLMDMSYLTYLVKCWPKVAKPKVGVATCKAWLWEELKLVNPRVIVPLGQLSSASLLRAASRPMKALLGRHKVPFLEGTVVPYYSPTWILNHGRKGESEALTFFKDVRELANA